MTRSTALLVQQPGPLTTYQDEGRIGGASTGVGRSGACDRAAYRLANRLVGNQPGVPALEVTLGGLVVRAESEITVVTAGAPCPGAPHLAPRRLATGDTLRLAAPTSGLRTYLAVRGGFEVKAVLGSCSTDVLGGLGPAVIDAGDRLIVGEHLEEYPGIEVAPVPDPAAGVLEVEISPGPRRDWFDASDWSLLCGQTYRVSSDSNRVGVRVEGEPIEQRTRDELTSEGLLRGGLQVPPSGLPVLFLADHPVTGGYPVIAYVVEADLDRCAQLRPGQGLRLRDHTSRRSPRFDRLSR